MLILSGEKLKLCFKWNGMVMSIVIEVRNVVNVLSVESVSIGCVSRLIGRIGCFLWSL